MRELFKSVGTLVYFIVAQVIGTLVLVAYKAGTDSTWVDKVGKTINQDGVLSSEYLILIGELIIPALIIADCLIIIPVLINSYRQNSQLIRSMSPSLAVKLFILGCALNTIVSYVVWLLPKSVTTDKYASLVSLVMIDNVFISFIVNAVLAALVEEIIFRKMIIGIYAKKSEVLAIIVSSVLFGLMHMNPIQSTYAFVLGVILGYVYVKTEYNLLSPLIIHVTINGTSILYEYAGASIKTLFITLGIMSVIAVLIHEIVTNNDELIESGVLENEKD